MIPTIKIDITQALAKLKRVESRSEDLPWNQAGEILKQSMQSNFDVGGRYSTPGSIKGGSTKWRPRKKSVAWRILKKSGRFQKSFYYTALGDGVKVGTKGIKYNAAQNFGRPEINLVARPSVVVQSVDLKKINKVFKKHVRK